MQRKKILLIIPAYNEEENIVNVVDKIRTGYPQYDYLVVNDGSTDSTAAICREQDYNYISLPINLGIGGAVQAGYRYACANGYEIAVQTDGDGQHDIAYVEKLVEPLLEGKADIAIGSRFLEKEGFQSSFFRRMGIHFFERADTNLYRKKDFGRD